MANRYLYQGVNAAFTRNTGTVVNSSTNTLSRFDTAYVDGCVNVQTGGICRMDFTDGDGANDYASAGETLWVRMDMWYGGGASTHTPVGFFNGADLFPVRLRGMGSNVYQFQRNTGTLAAPAWTQVGSNITLTSSTRGTFVIRLYIDPAQTDHSVTVYLGGTEQFTATFASTLLSEVHGVVAHEGQGTADGLNISQVLATVGINLVGSSCSSLKASGAGTYSEMTGAASDVNEVGVNDTTLVTSGTAGQKTTFAMSDLPALAGRTLGSEQRHVFRANNDGGAGPSNLKGVVRSAGADTVGGVVAGMGLGFGPLHHKLNRTYAEINAAGFELGWESAA